MHKFRVYLYIFTTVPKFLNNKNIKYEMSVIKQCLSKAKPPITMRQTITLFKLFIPCYNSLQCLSNLTKFICTVGANSLILVIYVCTRMYMLSGCNVNINNIIERDSPFIEIIHYFFLVNKIQSRSSKGIRNISVCVFTTCITMRN